MEWVVCVILNALQIRDEVTQQYRLGLVGIPMSLLAE